MKTLLLLVALVGVAVARPQQDQMSKLAGLLQRMLQEKQGPPPPPGSGSGSGSGDSDEEFYDFPPPGAEMESTLFEGLGPEFKPYKLFGGLVNVDFEKALDVSPEKFREFRERVRSAADAISNIGQRLADKINDYMYYESPRNLTFMDLVEFVQDELLPMVFEDDDSNIEEVYGETMVSLLRGAVAGTQGAPKDEPGCAFNTANKQEVFECIINKLHLLSQAIEMSFQQMMFFLESEPAEDGRMIEPCHALYNFYYEAYEYTPRTLLGTLQGTIGCIRGNMELVRDRIGVRASDLTDAPKPLPLPAMLATQAFLHHIGAHSYFAVDNIFEFLYMAFDMADEMGEFNYDEDDYSDLKKKKAFAQRKVAGSLYLSHSAKSIVSRSKALTARKAKKAFKLH